MPVFMACFTRSTMISRTAVKSGAALTSWTIRRNGSSMVMIRGGRGAGRVRQRAGQFLQCLTIDSALEVDHLTDGVPVTHPAPAVELRFPAVIEADVGFVAQQAQEKPFLLLADARILAGATHITAWQTVAQPALSLREDLHMRGLQPDLFVQLAIERIARGFTAVDTALGKLPSVVADAFGPEHAAVRVADHDAHIGAEAVLVDDIQGKRRCIRVRSGGRIVPQLPDAHQ